MITNYLKKSYLTYIAVLLTTIVFSFNVFAQQVQKDYTAKDLNEQMVMGAAWYYSSAETLAIFYQTFNMAKLIIDIDLQKGKLDKPRAVVVDIDETVLDNGPYQRGMIEYGFSHSSKAFNEWGKKSQASAIPGAVDFLNYAHQQGVDTFYVSNRDISILDATLNNLKALGFPQADPEHILLQTDTSDKEPRRKKIQETHKIVLLIGDNLNDFSSAFKDRNIVERLSDVENLKKEFGATFLILPNPMYGDWEGAIYGYNWKLTPFEKNRARKKAIGIKD